MLTKAEIQDWLHEADETRLIQLWKRADDVRREYVGDAVHLRGLLEVSNYCARNCMYCGIRADNRDLPRYRMTLEEIQEGARQAGEFGYGTVVMQAGEDYGITREWLADVIRWIKLETPLAVTLGMGERPEEDLRAWRQAGADRFLLRFETSDPELYERIHPQLQGEVSDRIALLSLLRSLGYEAGGGVMVGIPGQTYASLASDIALFGELDLDMVGVGPYIPHPATPLASNEWESGIADGDQVPNTELMTYKVLALTRLVCPEANLPSTTALATINRHQGRELGLVRGANVVMPNLTPSKHRAMYEIYPAKAGTEAGTREFHDALMRRLEAMGRAAGSGAGGRVKGR
jgi:biotin synthase